MARILIYDSDASVDSGNGAVTMGLVQGKASARRSTPFRCQGGLDDITRFAIEMVSDGSAINMAFEIEHYDDHPNLHNTTVQTARKDPIVTDFTSETWNVVQHRVDAGGGQIQCHDMIHYINLPDEESKKIPELEVRTFWARLKIWTVDAVPETQPRVLVWVIIGGHDNVDVLDALTAPYSYHDIHVA